MTQFVQDILGLASPWAYLLVGLLAAAEAAAFLGLVVPGETAVLLGGVVVATGHAHLGWMIVAAATGAVVGDSIGYELGRRLAGPLRGGRLGARVGERRWQQAEDYLRTRGGKAVFIGRWIGVLRALVPFVSGASKMPYRVFLPYNVAGGVLWAGVFVVAGYLAGNSYQVIGHYAGQASLILAGLLILGASFALGVRWVMRHPDRVHAAKDRVADWPPVRWTTTRYARQLAFLADRLRPRRAFGLVLTIELVALVAAGWFFGAVAEDALARNELIGINGPVARFFAARQEPWLTTAMVVTTWLGSAAVLVPAATLVAILAGRRLRSVRPTTLLAGAMVGSTVMAVLIKLLVVWPVSGSGLAGMGHAFPSGSAAASAAGWSAMAVVLGGLTTRWRPRVMLLSTALLLTLLVGLAQVYLGRQEPTAVLGGWALGAAWTAGVTAALRAYDDHRGSPAVPSPPERAAHQHPGRR